MTPLSEIVPADIRDLYEVHEWRHAAAILNNDFPVEWQDITEALRGFRLRRSEMVEGGGRKSKIATALDSAFYARGWVEKQFQTAVIVDTDRHESPTHKVDCFKKDDGNTFRREVDPVLQTPAEHGRCHHCA